MMGRIGQLVGNYRLVRLLGQGSFADVYLAEHLYLGTQAAIKILQIHLTNSDREDFRAEARIIARLEHPHIVEILDFGVEENIPYLVMDYAPNGTLRQRHPRGALLPLPSLISYTKQVADALQYVHSQRLIHRDVKPENMLIGSNEEILLSDFGIALLTQNSRSLTTQQTSGTIFYMAPEQIQGKPSFASDQYALGVVVYEWLCGECPFKGSFTEIATQHLFTAPTPLRKKVPTIPPAVEEVVLTALVKDPQQRFASVQAFVNALEQASQVEQSFDPLQFSGSQPTILPLPKPPSTVPSLLRRDPESPHNQGLIPVVHIQETQKTIPTPHSEKKVTSRDKYRNIFGSKRTLLMGLIFLVALGFLGILTFPLLNRTTAPIHIPMLASPNSAMFGFDPQHTHFNPNEYILTSANVSHLVLYWTAITGGRIYSSPAVVNGVVYVGSEDKKFYAFDAKTGAVLWTYTTGNLIGSSPAVVDGVVYVGSYDKKLYAFDAKTGAVLWTYTTGDIIESSPAVASGVVYVGSNDGKLYALDAKIGTSLWTYTTGGAILSSPAVANGVVYAGSNDLVQYAFNAKSGELLWTYTTSGPIGSSLAVDNERVYVSSFDGKLYALDAKTGSPIWTYITGYHVTSPPIVGGGVVYFDSWVGKGTLYGFDAKTGSLLWTYAKGSTDGGPVVVNGVLYVGSWVGKLYAFHLPPGTM